MSMKREAWAPVFERLSRGELHTVHAAQLIDRSERQVRRLLAAYRRRGSLALVHGNHGRRPARTQKGPGSAEG